MQSALSKSLFFVSADDSLHTLLPRIPDNFFTRNGFEENATPRVCLSTSIDGCLMALGRNIQGQTFQVYSTKPSIIYYPSTDEVPDCKITGEVWSLDGLRLQPLFKIKVLEADYSLPFRYGKKHAELYKWKWKKVK